MGHWLEGKSGAEYVDGLGCVVNMGIVWFRQHDGDGRESWESGVWNGLTLRRRMMRNKIRWWRERESAEDHGDGDWEDEEDMGEVDRGGIVAGEVEH